MNQKNQQSISKSNLDNSNVGWNASNLFYIFLNEIDMDYKEAYYQDNWNMMYKSFKIKYMKVRTFIKKYANEQENKLLNDDDTIKGKLALFKTSDTDYSNKWNNDIVQGILEIIEQKMMLVDELMSKAGMNILLQEIEKNRPAALGNDDFVFD